MKSFKLVLVSFLFFSMPLYAQDTDKQMNEAIAGIAGSLKAGNAAGIGNYMGSTVSLDIFGNERMYGKDQAVQILKDFFAKNSPKNYVEEHKGSQPQLRFSVGILQTHSGQSLRVSVFVKPDAGKVIIQRLIIENQ